MASLPFDVRCQSDCSILCKMFTIDRDC